jgi:hypothetical protein
MGDLRVMGFGGRQHANSSHWSGQDGRNAEDLWPGTVHREATPTAPVGELMPGSRRGTWRSSGQVYFEKADPPIAAKHAGADVCVENSVRSGDRRSIGGVGDQGQPVAAVDEHRNLAEREGEGVGRKMDRTPVTRDVLVREGASLSPLGGSQQQGPNHDVAMFDTHA